MPEQHTSKAPARLLGYADQITGLTLRAYFISIFFLRVHAHVPVTKQKFSPQRGHRIGIQ